MLLTNQAVSDSHPLAFVAMAAASTTVAFSKRRAQPVTRPSALPPRPSPAGYKAPVHYTISPITEILSYADQFPQVCTPGGSGRGGRTPGQPGH